MKKGKKIKEKKNMTKYDGKGKKREKKRKITRKEMKK